MHFGSYSAVCEKEEKDFLYLREVLKKSTSKEIFCGLKKLQRSQIYNKACGDLFIYLFIYYCLMQTESRRDGFIMMGKKVIRW